MSSSSSSALGNVESLEDELKQRNRQLHQANDKNAKLGKDIEDLQLKYTELLTKLS